jgi:hypothetical protein
MKTLLCAVFLSLLNIFCQGQEKTKNNKLNLPGDFILDIGFSSPLNAPSEFQTSYFGSRTANIYYLHEITLPFAKSKLSVLPGLGLGLDRFTFSNLKTLDYQSGDLVMTTQDLDMKKSQLIMNYFDIPVELQYSSNPSNPSRSLKVSVGFRFGVLFDSFTKIKYYENNTLIKDKSKRDWDLNKLRYGIYSRIGLGNFGIFTNYNFSPLFSNNNGPSNSSINVLTTGLFISGF